MSIEQSAISRQLVILFWRFKLIAVAIPTFHAASCEEFEVWSLAVARCTYSCAIAGFSLLRRHRRWRIIDVRSLSMKCVGVLDELR